MLSIIIPTYNEEKYLPKLLKSIRDQSIDEEYEIIVADNNSTDNTRKIARSYGAILTQGGSPGEGRNRGAKIAKGDTLLFLDADVELTHHFFLVDCLDEFEEEHLGCATCCVVPLSNRSIDTFGHETYNYLMRAVENLSPIAPGFCIWVKKEIHQSIGGFDEEIVLAEDCDYVRRASKFNKFGVLHSHKIPVSVRRLDRDGRFTIATKYVLCGLYLTFLGNVKTDIFKYTFGHK